MKRNKLARLYWLRNGLNYKKFMMLNNECCVFISESYFWCLVARAQRMSMSDTRVFEILNKYNDIEYMKNSVDKNHIGNNYMLMTYEDARYLIESLRITNFRKLFIKSTVKATDFEALCKIMKEQYINEQSKVLLKRIEKNNN